MCSSAPAKATWHIFNVFLWGFNQQYKVERQTWDDVTQVPALIQTRLLDKS